MDGIELALLLILLLLVRRAMAMGCVATVVRRRGGSAETLLMRGVFVRLENGVLLLGSVVVLLLVAGA